MHGRTPDIVIPRMYSLSQQLIGQRTEDRIAVGQVPYNSTISGIPEILPVSLSLVARRGCDFMLLDLVGKLADAGIITKVKAGRTAF